jgi:hypothetical protein
MKKYIIIILIILGLIVIIRDITVKKKLYSNNINSINELENDRDIFYSIFSNYYNQNNQYPSDINKDLINKEQSIDLQKQFKIVFNDPFSKNELYYYVPLKNDSGLNVGYCLLSSGPDGKVNRITEPLLLKDIDKIKLYKSKSFNYLDFYFGKRDLLISSVYNK